MPMCRYTADQLVKDLRRPEARKPCHSIEECVAHNLLAARLTQWGRRYGSSTWCKPGRCRIHMPWMRLPHASLHSSRKSWRQACCLELWRERRPALLRRSKTVVNFLLLPGPAEAWAEALRGRSALKPARLQKLVRLRLEPIHQTKLAKTTAPTGS